MRTKSTDGWTAASREDVVRLVQTEQAAIAKRLRAARERAGLTLDQVAEQLFISKAAVGHWETGHRAIGTGELKLIADLYGVAVQTFLGDEDRSFSPAALDLAKWFELLDETERERLPALVKILTDKAIPTEEVESKMPAVKARRVANEAIRKVEGKSD